MDVVFCIDFIVVGKSELFVIMNKKCVINLNYVVIKIFLRNYIYMVKLKGSFEILVFECECIV